ncbi:hypothetical protein HQ563_10465 [bacterium]|nr:hypothetical protein [bacterium]
MKKRGSVRGKWHSWWPVLGVVAALLVSAAPAHAEIIADAGPDQHAYVGDTVQLDGAGVDLSGAETHFFYYWFMYAVPSGSSASLSNIFAQNPTFVPDLPGDYFLTLYTQGRRSWVLSHPDTVVVHVTQAPVNEPPVADCNGPYIEPATSWAGALVTLDGSGSYDPEDDPLTYSWKIGADEIGTEPVVEYPFPIGETEVSLTVTDPSEESDTATTSVTVTVIHVAIDIKPGSDPNSINLASHGVIPVAFLTTVQFDASEIDPLTVTLKGEDFSGLVRLRGKKQAPMAGMEDVDGDGDLDLVVHLETENLALYELDEVCELGALTYGGLVVSGMDTIRLVP